MMCLHTMTQCDLNVHLRVNINQYDLHFKVQRFCLIFLDYLMNLCDHQILFSSKCRSVTYILWPSKFASYLEDYLVQESCAWDYRSVSLRDRHCKLYLALYHCH